MHGDIPFVLMAYAGIHHPTVVSIQYVYVQCVIFTAGWYCQEEVGVASS